MDVSPVLGWTVVVCGCTLTMGLLVVSGRWRSPVLKVYPGAGVGLTFTSVAFLILVAAVALLNNVPPLAFVFMPMLVLAGVSGVYGFIVGSFGPKRLLPRWQREELEREKNAER